MTHPTELRPRPNLRALFALLPLMVACSGGDGTMSAGSTGTCEPSAELPCTCPNGQVSFQRCAANGRGLGQCVCAATLLPMSDNSVAGSLAAAPGAMAAAGTSAASGLPAVPPAANGGTPGLPVAGFSGAGPGFPQNPATPPGNVPPVPASGSGAPVIPPTMAAGSGAPMPAAGSNAGTGGAAAGGDPMLEMARQVCLDTINMYRATKMLPPLMRMTAQESCSDAGAKKDGDSGTAHGSAFSCKGSYGQNTCPGYPVGGFGAATLSDALKQCLQQMWAEGEPPVSREQCQMDTTGCFEMHGHYLNMTQNFKGVSCGFYKMKNGNWWMNQDFF
jgi:hypothetical protein